MFCKYCRSKNVTEQDRIPKTVWRCPENQHVTMHEQAGSCPFMHPNKTVCGKVLEAQTIPSGEFACKECRAKRQGDPRQVKRDSLV